MARVAIQGARSIVMPIRKAANWRPFLLGVLRARLPATVRRQCARMPGTSGDTLVRTCFGSWTA
ncbi:MAG: hypothetical protein JSV72_16460, partial [Ralstonia sp.]